MEPILNIEHVCKSFGGLKAVNDVSLEIKKGSIVSLIGPNGAGKTTLFNIITGFYHADSGDICFDGIRTNDLKIHEYVKIGMARTFQNVRGFKELTVQENVIAGFQGGAAASPWSILFHTKNIPMQKS